MLIYALTVLVSSFLLFLVQPIIAKQIIPWFGGSAAVWTTCLTFFQLVLLAGYAYSDWVQRLAPKRQSVLHIILLVASLIAMPILAGEQWKPTGEEDPLLRILGLLAATIGLPYFMLSTTGPLIQSWFAREQTNPAVAQKAYRLFALSNFGSLLGLLAYPFAIEAWVTTKTQAIVWSAFYGLFVLITIAVAVRAGRSSAHPSAVSSAGPSATVFESADAVSSAHAAVQAPPKIMDLALWFCLAALATMILLAVSSHITQNIASIPFLWVLPLSLYLLTFVIAFEGRRGKGWYLRNNMMLPAMALCAVMAWGLVTDDGILDIDYAIPLYLTGMFLVCLFCHGELAHAKPQARYLTRFYFMIALGGAAGGLFVSTIAPRVFPFYWELPLALLLVGAAGVWIGVRTSIGPLKVVFVGGSLVSIALTAHYSRLYYADASSDSIYASRNFYGTLRIKERFPLEAQDPIRRLVHGVILHGLQDMNPASRQFPTTYYGPESGVGVALHEMARQTPSGMRVGVIGLGVGTLASYGRKGDHYRMYDINPDVIDIAKREFTYLSDSPAEISFALGDARLVLEREPSNGFDVLVIDAFSSDSIPIHLITREALQVYARHMKPGGVIAFHVTNRYLNLSPVVRQVAEHAGYQAVLVVDDAESDTRGLMALSDWVLVTKNEKFVNSSAIRERTYAFDEIPGLKLWTDDFNNLFKVLK
jgi:SAM-dependent methyltransferase